MNVLFEVDYNHGNQAQIRGWIVRNGVRKEAKRMISRYADNSGLETKKNEIREELKK